MRNLSADLTRFVPTTLKVKKDAPIIRKDVARSSTVTPHIEWKTPAQVIPVRIFGNRLMNLFMGFI